MEGKLLPSLAAIGCAWLGLALLGYAKLSCALIGLA